MSAPHHIECWSDEGGMWQWYVMDALGGMLAQSASAIEDRASLTTAMAELYPGVPIYEVESRAMPVAPVEE